ncbi:MULTISPECIES: hypothetical protein [unclassified Streptomyces]|uniref:hypothetical protein n=1 Tax=unclassified Streptomyces TaxID=2593676 RepID=UPI003318C0F8
MHYVQVGGGMGGGMGRGSGAGSQMTQWIQEHGTAVEESEYADASASSGVPGDDSASQAENTSAVYRLDPSDVA